MSDGSFENGEAVGLEVGKNESCIDISSPSASGIESPSEGDRLATGAGSEGLVDIESEDSQQSSNI